MLYQIEIRKSAFAARQIHSLLPTPHIHSELELVYLTKGKSIAVLDNQKYMLGAGELFLAFPNQIHYYLECEQIEGYLIIFSGELFIELKELFQTKILQDPVFHKEQLPKDTMILMEKMAEKKKTKSLYDELTAKGCLLALMGELFSNSILVDNPTESDSINDILKYCSKNYTNEISLEKMSKELYLSKYHISRVFRERLKMSYKDFVNKLRVDRACEVMEKGRNITEVAYEVGFSSVRTFNRAFFKHKEMTPREYVKIKELLRNSVVEVDIL